ncbi:hypothetical protein HU200_030056 [Digitaria exilis]|uniref:Uncharacterized protein n=1 Tax=Digitaria exilis TaxID=1010633 RepID=A0A835BPD5_9POAL|nr:hypothetical protein HU200_030056 [Digitaria exilis]
MNILNSLRAAHASSSSKFSLEFSADNDQDERALYLYSLQNESFMVAIANTSKRIDGCAVNDEALPVWEITRAQKCE